MKRLWLFSAILFAFPVFGQRTFQIQKATTSIKIDGLLSENDWQLGIPAKDFINNSPDYGKPASKSTNVWMLYDDEAIYIAAKLTDVPNDWIAISSESTLAVRVLISSVRLVFKA